MIIEGKKIYFSPLVNGDISKGWLNWVNNPIISGNLNSPGYPQTLIDLENYLKLSKPPETVMFAVCLKLKDRYIGNARISKIDHFNKKCTFGRLIGDLSLRNQGIGTEITSLILKYCFINLGMNKVYTHVFEENISSISSNLKAGLQKDGLLREEYMKNGEFKNVQVLSILKREYLS